MISKTQWECGSHKLLVCLRGIVASAVSSKCQKLVSRFHSLSPWTFYARLVLLVAIDRVHSGHTPCQSRRGVSLICESEREWLISWLIWATGWKNCFKIYFCAAVVTAQLQPPDVIFSCDRIHLLPSSGLWENYTVSTLEGFLCLC